MTPISKHNISADRAMDLIISGQPLNDAFVKGELKLEGLDNFNKPLIASNCIFEYINAVMSQFGQLVKLSDCECRKCDFSFSYFLGGLEIDNCVFENYLDFQAGGHNQNEKVVLISNCIFKGFVNFLDCWYESGFIMRKNDFQKGTNILGKLDGLDVTFDVTPIIEDNKGRLDFDDEGDVESKAVYLK
jgi:hypothetical protein